VDTRLPLWALTMALMADALMYLYLLMCVEIGAPKGWHLVDEADNDAEGYENSRVDDEGDDPEGADLLFVHVLCCLCLAAGESD